MPLREAPRYNAKIFGLENVKNIPESRALLRWAWGQSRIGCSLFGFDPYPPKSEQAEARSPQRRILRQASGGNMKIVLNIVGALLVLIGAVWFLQGINVLPGSFMTGQTRWAVRGGILIFAGVCGLLWAKRKRRGPA